MYHVVACFFVCLYIFFMCVFFLSLFYGPEINASFIQCIRYSLQDLFYHDKKDPKLLTCHKIKAK